MNFRFYANTCARLVDAAGASRIALWRRRMHHARGCDQSLRFAAAAGGRCRVHRGSAETGYGEGDDESADGEILHEGIYPWQ